MEDWASPDFLFDVGPLGPSGRYTDLMGRLNVAFKIDLGLIELNQRRIPCPRVFKRLSWLLWSTEDEMRRIVGHWKIFQDPTNAAKFYPGSQEMEKLKLLAWDSKHER